MKKEVYTVAELAIALRFDPNQILRAVKNGWIKSVNRCGVHHIPAIEAASFAATQGKRMERVWK